MTVKFAEIKINTVQARPSYHMISDEIKKVVKSSNVENGICLVQTTHTTCSIYFDEYMHDRDCYGDDFLQVDLNNILEKIIPRQTTENVPYKSPGPEHIKYGMAKKDPNYPAIKWTMLNTDGHLRSDLLGSSVTCAIKDGDLQLGSVGQIFFVDFDQTRPRERTILITILGE